ncbi:MAG: hypothetical protein JNL97_04605, partial [Verrucomicrobiales bacterium]|nr:hypothetical protein [Verrucomicrobiales bacterium]
MAFSRFIAGSRQGTRATAGILAAFLPTLMGSTAVSQTTGAVPPGVAPCITNAVPAGYGTLLLVGSASFAQTGDTAPAEAATPSPLVTAEVTSPSAFVVSNALVASTKGFSLALASIGQGRSLGATQYVSEAALLGSLSAGNYNASFQLAFPNGETFVGFSVFGVASNLPPVPQISAFAAAQSIDASAPFALNWLPWIGSGTNDRIALVIADAAGNAVVSAATDCSGTTDLP